MADSVGYLAVIAAGAEQEIGIACRIDHLLRENRLPPLLGLENNALHLVPVLNDIHTPGMEEHLDSGLGDHPVHQVLGPFGIHRRLPVDVAVRPLRAIVSNVAAERMRPIRKLRDKSSLDKPPLAVFVRRRAEHDQHHAVGEKAAKRTIALDKRHFRSGACGGNRGREAGRTAANHHYIRFVEDRQLVGRLVYDAIPYEAARAIRHCMLKRKYLLRPGRNGRIADRTRRNLAG